MIQATYSYKRQLNRLYPNKWHIVTTFVGIAITAVAWAIGG